MFVVVLVVYVLALVLVVGLGAATTAVNPRRRAAAAQRFAAGAGVELTPELATDVARRLARRDWFDVVGRLAGVLAIFVLGGVLGVGGLFFGLLAGLGGARGLAQLTEVRRATARGARVTHLLAPRLTDYVRPVAVFCVRAVALLPVGLAVLWYAAPERTQPPEGNPGNGRTVLAVAGVTLISLLIAEVGAWLVLRLRRVAGTPAELALDDAFRVSALRDLSVLPMVLGVFGSLLLGGLLETAVFPDSSGPAGAWLAGGGAGVLAALAIGVESARARTWRRRLHPELTPR
jgi:hypothetical protein